MLCDSTNSNGLDVDRELAAPAAAKIIATPMNATASSNANTSGSSRLAVGGDLQPPVHATRTVTATWVTPAPGACTPQRLPGIG
jgi:hypothetical protein